MKTVEDLLGEIKANPALESQIKEAASAAGRVSAGAPQLDKLLNYFAETPSELSQMRADLSGGGEVGKPIRTTTTLTTTTMTSGGCTMTTTTTTITSWCKQA